MFPRKRRNRGIELYAGRHGQGMRHDCAQHGDNACVPYHRCRRRQRKELTRILRDAVAESFNTLNVDGATSTNDTVFLLANGRAGKPEMGEFAAAVRDLCLDLTMQMARDAEGVTKVVRLTVSGAASAAEARACAKAIAENNLVKCSWFGSDPYWGRILAAAGSAGVDFHADDCFVAYGGILRGAGRGRNTARSSGGPCSHETSRSQHRMRLWEPESRRPAQSGSISGPGYIKENSVTS